MIYFTLGLAAGFFGAVVLVRWGVQRGAIHTKANCPIAKDFD